MEHTKKTDHTLPSFVKNPSKPIKVSDKDSGILGGLLSSVKYTIQSFINDPLGSKGITETKYRKAQLEKLTRQYEVLLKRHGGKFKWKVYQVADSIIMKVEVPSETVSNVTYDACVEFLGVSSTNTSLLDKNIRIFSNNAAFTFSCAYVFEKQGLLIPYFRSKLTAESLEKAPKIRNPNEEMNYEKSIVFAMMFIRQFRLHMFENYGKERTLLNKISVKNAVRSFEEVDRAYKGNKKLMMEGKVTHGMKSAVAGENQMVITKHHRAVKGENLSTNAKRREATVQSKLKKSNLVDRSVNNKVNTKVKNKVSFKLA
jgi:hypothetical protein